MRKQPDPQHGAKNSWLRQTLTLASIRLLRHIRPHRGSVLMLTSKICVKCGHGRNISEADTMVYVAQHTSIPVPRVICTFQKSNITYIVMERVKGVSIAKVWKSLSEDQKESFRAELRGYLAELRASPPRPGQVCDVNCASLYDDRIAAGRFGPFTSSRDFHRFLRCRIDGPVKDDVMSRLIHDHEWKEYETCFTHGDLSSFNILARNDGRVVGIIDWEMAGWYPEYWEYTSAWHVNPYDWWWRPEVEKILEMYPAELEMEKTRRKLFSVFGGC